LRLCFFDFGGTVTVGQISSAGHGYLLSLGIQDETKSGGIPLLAEEGYVHAHSMARYAFFRCCAYQFPKSRTADAPFSDDLTQALVTQKDVVIENRTEALMLATATTDHSYTCFLWAIRLLSSHRRNEVVNNGEQSGTKHHDEDPWKNEEHHRNNHLDRQFGCLFFRPLSALGSKRI